MNLPPVSIEWVASVTAFLVITVELIKKITDIFGGSPEMRAIRAQLDANNEEHRNVLLAIAARVNAIAQRFGV